PRRMPLLDGARARVLSHAPSARAACWMMIAADDLAACLRDCHIVYRRSGVVMALSRTRHRLLLLPGLRVKQLVLGIGAVYFTFVAVTNIVNFIVSVGGYHWTFLNSGNVSYITSVTKIYAWPAWFDKAAVLAAALA